MMTRMQEAADRASKGIRDPDAMREACERMDRISDEVRRNHGLLDIGVAAIRELREAGSTCRRMSFHFRHYPS
jgi:hypothetical protein